MDIRYAPTIVFLDRLGTEIFRYDSYRKPEHFAMVLRYLATGAYTQYSSFQDWLRAGKAPTPPESKLQDSSRE
jgi:thioredoxin-related protein